MTFLLGILRICSCGWLRIDDHLKVSGIGEAGKVVEPLGQLRYAVENNELSSFSYYFMFDAILHSIFLKCFPIVSGTAGRWESDHFDFFFLCVSMI